MRGLLCRCFPPNLQYWDDRLRRLQALGINTVDTYVPWNLHEPTRGKFRFDANSWTDIERYIKLVQSKGLMMLLRIGPYICAGGCHHSTPSGDSPHTKSMLHCGNQASSARAHVLRRLIGHVESTNAGNKFEVNASHEQWPTTFHPVLVS